MQVAGQRKSEPVIELLWRRIVSKQDTADDAVYVITSYPIDNLFREW